MERKLIAQGTGGYTIYLPKKWLSRQQMGRGSTVDVRDMGSHLAVAPSSRKNKTVQIDFETIDKEDIKNMLTHLYRVGVDVIIFKGCKTEDKLVIREKTKEYLLGFEVTEDRDDECIVRCVSDLSISEYKPMLRRCFLLVKQTQERVHEDFRNGVVADIEGVRAEILQQDRFVLFCRRMLFSGGIEREVVTTWELLTFLMHIEHAYYYMYIAAKGLKSPVDAKTRKLLRILEDYFDMFYKAFYDRDVKLVHTILTARKDWEPLCTKAIKSGKNPIIASRIREIFRTLQVATSPIYSSILHDESTKE